MISRFATGLVAGGILAAVGVSYLMTEPKKRKRFAREGKRALREAGNYISDMF